MRYGAALLVLLLLSRHALADDDLLKWALQGDRYTEFKNAIGTDSKLVNELRDSEGNTLLHLAAAGRHQEGVAALLFAGAKPNAKNGKGWTPLFHAIAPNGTDPLAEDSLMIAEMLVKAGADTNAVAVDGTTPLLLAVASRDAQFATLLVRAGAKPHLPGVPDSMSPVAQAWRNNDQQMVDIIESRGSTASSKDLGRPTAKTLDEAIIAADFNAFENLITNGAEIDQRDSDGATALYRAVSACRPEFVTWLLLKGANPNIATNAGRTPLMESVRFANLTGYRMAALLLLSAADPNASTKEGESILVQAISASNSLGTKLLVWRGADLKQKTSKGSVMQLALFANWAGTITVLKECGVAEESRTSNSEDGVPAIVTAVHKGDYEGVKTELEKGVSPSPSEAPDILGEAFRNSRLDIADLLLRYGANINYQNKYGWNTLFVLARQGSDGQTVRDVEFAAKNIEEMVKRGANVNIVMNDGTTPLMIAAREGLTGANTEALLKAGANINARNKKGQTALGVARQYGQKEMIEFLKVHGAVE